MLTVPEEVPEAEPHLQLEKVKVTFLMRVPPGTTSRLREPKPAEPFHVPV